MEQQIKAKYAKHLNVWQIQGWFECSYVQGARRLIDSIKSHFCQITTAPTEEKTKTKKEKVSQNVLMTHIH